MFPCVWENVNLTDFTLHCFCKLGKTLSRVPWDLHHSFEVYKGTGTSSLCSNLLQLSVRLHLWNIALQHHSVQGPISYLAEMLHTQDCDYCEHTEAIWKCFLCSYYRHYFSDVTPRTHKSVYTCWADFKSRAPSPHLGISHHGENVRSRILWTLWSSMPCAIYWDSKSCVF